MSKFLFFLLIISAIFQSAYSSQDIKDLDWNYDRGPNPKTRMGKELIELNAKIPCMPCMSGPIIGKQKFRPAFGPIPWRMLQKPNSVKILFIGQDGTHIAEASGRPATAGFGGRAQDLANYFGVDYGAAFINTYAFTIKGQYGAFKAPMIKFDKEGNPAVTYKSFVDNELWLLTQDQRSPVVKWRNDLIDWIIRNNKDSLKLVVLFGGAARDAAATYVESKGGLVGVGSRANGMKEVQIPEAVLKYAGGNNVFPVPLTRNDKDLFTVLGGKKLDYSKASNQEIANKLLKENIGEAMEQMVFSKGGPYGNGMLHPAQVGGYDLKNMKINGKKTMSIKGLRLNDGSRIKNNVLVVQLPHPSALSRLDKKTASGRVARALEDFEPYVKKGWKIKADNGQVNDFDLGRSYVYARAGIGPEYYDFGTPGTRMLPVSDASRMSKNAHVIILGTRDKARFSNDKKKRASDILFDKEKMEEATTAKAADRISSGEMFIARPRTTKLRSVFDPGPPKSFAYIMKSTLDLKNIFATKAGKSLKSDGMEALNVKNHPRVADFGHYRGSFENPEVIILADPDGYDDIITARALTGTRGQYLDGMIQSLPKVKDNYLVIKTVPFGMDEATDKEWASTLKKTMKYRAQIFDELFKTTKPKLIIADGRYASAVIAKLTNGEDVPVVKIKRKGTSNNSGIDQALKDIKKIAGFGQTTVKTKMSDIPRSHLSYYARVWEGTSGDRVLNAVDKKHKGFGFAEIVPSWAFNQKPKVSASTKRGMNQLLKVLEENNLPLPGEKMRSFVKRSK